MRAVANRSFPGRRVEIPSKMVDSTEPQVFGVGEVGLGAESSERYPQTPDDEKLADMLVFHMARTYSRRDNIDGALLNSPAPACA
jgi:hypothetical protein